MKFNLNTDKIEDLKLTFSDLEYEKDIADIIADFSYGMGAFFVDFAVKLNCNTEQARVLKDVVISCLGRNIDDFLDRDVLDHDDETAEQSEEQALYDKMVEMYAEWLENECSYDDEDKLIQDIKQYGVMPCMLYNDDEDTPAPPD